MRQLVLGRSVLEAFKAGDTVRLVKGTRVKYISEEQLDAECKVYSEAGIDE